MAGTTEDELVEVPVELFRALVFLQAHYAGLLNAYDGGSRQPVQLPPALARFREERDGDN